MNFVVTARKWRPQTFEEVVGQEHITKTLKNAINNNRIAHAYIFAGPRGVGKTTTARILAKSLNCLNPKDGEPCNECEMCKAFQTSQTLDVIEIDGASNRRIEEIRTLRESVKYAPSKGNFKIYIIDEVHMLTNESFNALLKTLEEPPEHTIFVFATTDIHKVPLTIISRCQRFDFRRIELGALKTQLKKIAEAEKIKIDDQSLTLIAKKADGALRDAQSLFDQVISFCGDNIKADDITKMLNLINEEIYFDLSDAIIEKKYKSAFEISQRIYENGWNFIDFMNGLIEHFRNILTVVIRDDYKLIESAEIFKQSYLKYKNDFSEGDILRILSYLNKALYELKSTQNQKLKVEISLSHIIGLERSATISELIDKIKSPNSIQQSTNYNVANSRTPNSEGEKKKSVNNFTKSQKSPRANKKADTFKNISSNTVVSNAKWVEFVESLSGNLTIGPILVHSKLFESNNNVLSILIQNKDDYDIIKNNLNEIQTKAKKFFGSDFQLRFTLKHSEASSHPNSHETNSSDNILIKAVKEKLGGKEIS